MKKLLVKFISGILFILVCIMALISLVFRGTIFPKLYEWLEDYFIDSKID